MECNFGRLKTLEVLETSKVNKDLGGFGNLKGPGHQISSTLRFTKAVRSLPVSRPWERSAKSKACLASFT